MDKYIFKKKSLTSDQCKEIIKAFNDAPEKDVYNDVYRGYLMIKGDVKTSPVLHKIIREGLDIYVEKHPFLKLCTPWNIDISCNIQKYVPGNAYKVEHMEYGDHPFDCKRLLGWMIYLNDCDGGTCFPQQNFTTKPKEGDLYIWPAGWTHSHYGISATVDKYIITGWCGFIGDD